MSGAAATFEFVWREEASRAGQASESRRASNESQGGQRSNTTRSGSVDRGPEEGRTSYTGSASRATRETREAPGGEGALAVARRVASVADTATGTRAASSAIATAGMAAEALGGGLAVTAGALLALGPPVIAFGIAAGAAKIAMDEANKATKELVGFSGELANATAMNQARQVLQNINRGQAMGAGLGRYTAAQGDMSRAAQRLTDTLIPVFVEVAVPILNKVTDILEAITSGTIVVEKAFADLPFEIQKLIAQYLERDPVKVQFLDFMETMMNAAIDLKHRPADPLMNPLIANFLQLGPAMPVPKTAPRERRPNR